MTKSDLIEAMASRFPEIKKSGAEIVVDTLFDCIADELAKGGRVEIRGFGSFSVRVRESRLGRNPKTGDSVQVPKKVTPFFTVGKELKGRVDERKASSLGSSSKTDANSAPGQLGG